MQHTVAKRFHNPAVLIFIGLLGLLTACLYSHPGHISDDEVGRFAATLDGLEVELLRNSTRCSSMPSAPLVAKVGVGCEFPGDEVKRLGSSCAEAPSPGVDVYVEDDHVIFDFSNVAEPGRFTGADFDGYIIDIQRRNGGAIIFGADVDGVLTTVDIDKAALSHDYYHLEVNFRGVSYDDDSFVKIDLWLAGVAGGD